MGMVSKNTSYIFTSFRFFFSATIFYSSPILMIYLSLILFELASIQILIFLILLIIKKMIIILLCANF